MRARGRGVAEQRIEVGAESTGGGGARTAPVRRGGEARPPSTGTGTRPRFRPARIPAPRPRRRCGGAGRRKPAAATGPDRVSRRRPAGAAGSSTPACRPRRQGAGDLVGGGSAYDAPAQSEAEPQARAWDLASARGSGAPVPASLHELDADPHSHGEDTDENDAADKEGNRHAASISGDHHRPSRAPAHGDRRRAAVAAWSRSGLRRVSPVSAWRSVEGWSAGFMKALPARAPGLRHCGRRKADDHVAATSVVVMTARTERQKADQEPSIGRRPLRA